MRMAGDWFWYDRKNSRDNEGDVMKRNGTIPFGRQVPGIRGYPSF